MRLLCHVFFCFLVLGILSPAFADDIFMIEDLSVEVDAANAVEAKEKAFIQARAEAFKALSERLLTDSELEKGPEMSDAQISALIKNFKIKDERMSSKGYKANFTFYFKEPETRRLFKQGGYQYSDIKSGSVLILPFYEVAGNATIWGEQNPWFSAWKTVDTYKGQVPVIVPLGDTQDFGEVNERDPLSYDLDKLQIMKDRYKARKVFISILNDRQEILLYDASGYQPILVKTFTVSDVSPEILQGFVKTVHSFMQRDWKEQTAISENSPQGTLQVMVYFNGLGEWISLRSALDRVTAVDSYDMINLNADHAEIKLNFAGSFQRLSLALEQEGLVIEQPEIQGQYDSFGNYFYKAANQKPILRKL
ncbi:MAG: hypothetical protein CMH30_05410 [Micavibrio sp.]|nr:hypothetical protein [Micavibrio sp.]|tara:strand:+ start:2167 stop:3261 length:1095 start_codon:yes stop_codon:yes gene_type:complete